MFSRLSANRLSDHRQGEPMNEPPRLEPRSTGCHGYPSQTTPPPAARRIAELLSGRVPAVPSRQKYHAGQHAI